MNTNTGLTFIRAHEKILWRQRNLNYLRPNKAKLYTQPLTKHTSVETELDLCCCDGGWLTIESFSVVVNLARISPRFDDQGSKSCPTASSSLSLLFLPRSWNHNISLKTSLGIIASSCLVCVEKHLSKHRLVCICYPCWSAVWHGRSLAGKHGEGVGPIQHGAEGVRGC